MQFETKTRSADGQIPKAGGAAALSDLSSALRRRFFKGASSAEMSPENALWAQDLLASVQGEGKTAPSRAGRASAGLLEGADGARRAFGAKKLTSKPDKARIFGHFVGFAFGESLFLGYSAREFRFALSGSTFLTAHSEQSH